jgi:ferredoxin
MHEQVPGSILFNSEACRGCGLCVESCRSKARSMSTDRNHHGVHPARYLGEACVRCGTCYYFCPELGANTVIAPRMAPGRASRYWPAA